VWWPLKTIGNVNAESVKAALDYPAFYGQHVQRLQSKGNGQALGLCPFHDDKNPSLSVNLDSGLFRCFGCGKSGDAFSFYQEVTGADFPTAVTDLATTAGLSEAPKGKAESHG
jgi:DNA primase